MWAVTFYRAAEPIAEIEILEAPTMIHAIVYAANRLPETLDRSDNVDAVEIPNQTNEETHD